MTTWEQKASGRPTIVFCVDRAHSKAVCDDFVTAGIPAEHIDMATPEDERTAMFARYRRGETKVLCSINVLAVGFDETSASCAVLARPTLSLALHVQQIGRVMRPHDGKHDALVLDHAGNVLRHGKVEDFDPPELSEIDRRSDKKRKTQDETDCFPCPSCRALMSPGQRVCAECGHEVARKSIVHFVPGELTEDRSAPYQRKSVSEMRDLYLQARWIYRSRGKNEGTAFYLIKDEFGFKPPWAWRDLAPVEPSNEALRLVRSRAIKYRKAQQRAEARH